MGFKDMSNKIWFKHFKTHFVIEGEAKWIQLRSSLD